jgi:hypothetical protein
MFNRPLQMKYYNVKPQQQDPHQPIKQQQAPIMYNEEGEIINDHEQKH